nr:unnamed protein product [Callosobruchus chinensis]
MHMVASEHPNIFPSTYAESYCIYDNKRSKLGLRSTTRQRPFIWPMEATSAWLAQQQEGTVDCIQSASEENEQIGWKLNRVANGQ